MGFDTISHDQIFKRTAQDEFWLPKIGRKNWRILTADQEMETLHHEAIVEGNAGVFILSDIRQGETYLKWVEMIAKCQQQIRHACTRSRRPFVARISKDGVLYRIRHLKTHRRTEDITLETRQDASIFGIRSGHLVVRG